jgi:superfamily I DNA/RNA helicase
MEYIVLAGDDDQCIFDFTGATPDAFLATQVQAEKRVLNRSYRVPQSVYRYASAWVQQLAHREVKAYQPREAVGTLRSLNINYQNSFRLLDDMQAYLSDGKSVMLLTSCSYMLEPVIAGLRGRGIPFHNPYRRTRGDWNPLASSKGVSIIDRLLAFLRPQESVYGANAQMWTYGDVANWADLIKADGVFKRGFKTELTKRYALAEVDLGWLASMMDNNALSSAFHGDLDWLYTHTLTTKRSKLQFPMDVIDACGVKALREKPKVIVGTIHSVKGGEADVVYVFPDISRAGMQEWTSSGSGHDALVRLYYVAMTRARDTLVVCDAVSTNAITLPVVQGERHAA